jgi:hypothetical protein
MKNKKLVTKTSLLVISFLLVFFIGLFIGNLIVPIYLINKYEDNIINYIYEEIGNNFGYKTQYDREKYEVVGGINLKDATFSIIVENGVKTIRAYKYIHENDKE